MVSVLADSLTRLRGLSQTVAHQHCWQPDGIQDKVYVVVLVEHLRDLNCQLYAAYNLANSMIELPR